MAARNLAILHIAIYDAVNAVRVTHRPYLREVIAAQPASPEAAATAAAHRVLVNLYPSERAAFASALDASLSRLTNNAAKTNGLTLGVAVADAMLKLRAADGASMTVPYIPSDAPGAWRRTLPIDRPQELPQWRYVKPFALTNAAQFRPPGPPPLRGTNYAFDFNQEIGRAHV